MLSIKAILDWRFLPAKFQNWLFNRATNVVEFVNVAALLGVALVLLVDKGALYAIHAYHKFQSLPEPAIIATLVGCALLQLLPLVLKGLRKSALSGYALLLSGLVWFLVAVAFYAGYPPLNFGMVFAPIFSFICVLAGRNLIVFSVALDNLKG